MALNETQKKRMSIVAGGLILAFAAALFRLYQLQCLEHEKYEKLASQQHLTRIPIPVRRGTILDTRGNPLAISLPVNSAYADPQIIRNKYLTAEALAPALKIDRMDIFAKLLAGRRFAWLKRKLDPAEEAAIQRLKLKGIAFRREYRRAYPHQHALGQVLGFVGLDDNGLAGLEVWFDKELTGQPGYEIAKRDAAGTPMADPSLEGLPGSNGLAIMLTIDGNIQHVAEEELAKACEKHRPDSGVALVVEPATGEILAMANWPSFDPNTYTKLSPEHLAKLEHNSAVLDVYEPGSTFKPFTVCAALEEKVVTEGTVFDCENGHAVLYRRTLRDAHGHGRLTVAEIITFSSNIGMAKVGIACGPERVHRFVRAFGFATAAGLPIKGEPSGMITPLPQWTTYTITSVPMGQEVAVTAVQMASAYSAIAMGGKLMKPHLVRKIANPDTGEVIKDYPPEQVRQVVSTETARKLTEMMVNVVDVGTGRMAQIEGYRIAGKTGTAQKPLPNRRGYSSDAYSSSFVGYAPAFQPRICVLVKLDTPRAGSHYGGVVAAPAAREIIRRTLAYLHVPPEAELLANKNQKTGAH